MKKILKPALIALFLITPIICLAGTSFSYSCLDNINDYVVEYPRGSYELDFESCDNIDDQGIPTIISFLSKHQEITTLNLEGNNISAKGAAELAKSGNTALTRLILNDNKIGSKGAIALAANTQLQRLEIEGNNVGTEGVAALAKNTTLTELDLADNPLHTIDIQALAQSYTLKSLMLGGKIKLSRKAIEALASTQAIEELWLYDVTFEKKNAIETLASSSRLKSLGFSRVHLCTRDFQALKNDNHLDQLIIFNNVVGDEEAKLLATMPIKDLELPFNNLHDAGAIALAGNTTLTKLDVAYNHIGAAGIAALRNNKTIVDLDVEEQS